MEEILKIIVKELGVDKANEIIASFETKEKPKETKTKEKTEAKEKTNKRITRMSPTLANQLKAAIKKVNSDINVEDKKEFDKMKKTFVEHVESLDENTFTSHGLDVHMTRFAEANFTKTKGGAVSGITTDIEDTVKPLELSIEELRKVQTVSKVGNLNSNVFWDLTNGVWVTGPSENEDEDMQDMKFNGKDYAVGVNTGRVYEVTEKGDIFAGFSGVGRFKDLTV